MTLYLTAYGTHRLPMTYLEKLPDNCDDANSHLIALPKGSQIRVNQSGVITVDGTIAGYYASKWSKINAKNHAKVWGFDITLEIEYSK